MQPLNWKVVGPATGSFFTISFVLCVVYDLIFPGQAMYESWIRLLPGFEWITWASFFLGAIESFGYGFYVALVYVPLYNFFRSKLG